MHPFETQNTIISKIYLQKREAIGICDGLHVFPPIMDKNLKQAVYWS